MMASSAWTILSVRITLTMVAFGVLVPRLELALVLDLEILVLFIMKSKKKKVVEIRGKQMR